VDRVVDEGTNVPEIAEVTAETLSFEEFFEEHHRRLFSALCAATANRQEAEEVMQEAFLKLWERWDRWDRVSGLEDPVGYLYRTAMNVFRKRLRRAKLAVRKTVGAFRRGGSATCCDAGTPSEGDGSPTPSTPRRWEEWGSSSCAAAPHPDPRADRHEACRRSGLD
jgi:RNA polymerase sigma factor (sigma-70 family)